LSYGPSPFCCLFSSCFWDRVSLNLFVLASN
jgi:hypothetical protein